LTFGSRDRTEEHVLDAGWPGRRDETESPSQLMPSEIQQDVDLVHAGRISQRSSLQLMQALFFQLERVDSSSSPA
jgi:hypothetical protein